jgi:heat shock protein HtpX
MVRRVFLFILVNILVILTISITLNVLNVRPYLRQSGIDYQALLIFCAVVGFVGALMSLAMSRFMAKMLMRIQLIDPNAPQSREEKVLLDMVYRYAREVGIATMPQVGIYESPEVNAFATGPTRNSALVAVSTGLLQRMDQNAVEGVVAHEVAHIANGDMVTMTLVQAVVNVFVMFFARIAAWAVASFLTRGDDEEGGGSPSYFVMFMLTIVFEIFLSIFGSIVVCYFSRLREFAADRKGALLAGKDKMIHALQTLKASMGMIDNSHQSLATLKINGSDSRFMRLFATHPNLDERIARLRSM